MTDSAFPGLTEAETLFKELVWDPLLKAGENALEAAVPALAFPVLKQVDEEVIQIIADAIYARVVELIDISSIKIMNSLHQAAFDDAMVTLKLVSIEYGNQSPQYQKELANAKIALSKFTRYGATT